MWGNVSPVVSIHPPLYGVLAFIPALRPTSADACIIVPITRPKPSPDANGLLARKAALIERAQHLRNRSRRKEASLIEAELRAVTMQILRAGK